MYADVNRLACCGLRELSGVSGYRSGNIDHLVRELFRSEVITNDGRLHCGGLIFSMAGARSKYGNHLAADIEAAGFGTIQKMKTFKNPNTGRIITTYLWTLDGKAINKYAKEHNIKNPDRSYDW